jgi:hypothetical protein
VPAPVRGPAVPLLFSVDGADEHACAFYLALDGSESFVRTHMALHVSSPGVPRLAVPVIRWERNEGATPLVTGPAAGPHQTCRSHEGKDPLELSRWRPLVVLPQGRESLYVPTTPTPTTAPENGSDTAGQCQRKQGQSPDLRSHPPSLENA